VRYSFSGSARVSILNEERISAVIANLVDGEAFGTGAAYGVDSLACRVAVANHPEAAHSVYVPSGAHNEQLVAWARRSGLTMELVPPGSHPYRQRNVRLVDHCDPALHGGEPGCLIAFPEGPEESYPRSGTWMTIRIARERGVPVAIYPLSDFSWGRAVSRRTEVEA
jgi:predicted Rossmann fold nucleotide-binding protein DprA/Smf involved in DNA uptake